VIIIVLDSLGIGALPDAADYGDEGADTLLHILEAVLGMMIPNLLSLGLGNIKGAAGGRLAVKRPQAAYARLAEASKGKDTITGHWEIAGLFTSEPFRTFERFPDSFMSDFEKRIGVATLGNYPASGTVIIEELGFEHENTGKPIVYTSADSVFQIAANTDVIPLEQLYSMCAAAREMLTGSLSVGRVIARPYIVKDGKRVRTSERRDYAVSPPRPTMLDYIKGAGKTVCGIGKISDIFNGKGITESIHTDGNSDGVAKTAECMKRDFSGLIFTNLVDFDSKFGHRRDCAGYAGALEEFDAALPGIISAMREDDMLILCADHGNDPAHSGWDHTREAVPAIVFGKGVKAVDLGARESFADIGATVMEALVIEGDLRGSSFFQLIYKG
jgi:phosphopentomutase